MALRTFATEALADFHTTAAVTPSSRYLTRAMLEPLPLGTAKVLVELGAGTGAITRALLERISDKATLLCFEINARFFHYLRGNFSDPRLVLIHSKAENLAQELSRRGCSRVDAAVSSLGLGFMSEGQRHDVLAGLVPFLDQKSVFTQYQYIHGLQFGDGRLGRFSTGQLLGQFFGSVQRKTIWRNIPPAFVFTCRK